MRKLKKEEMNEFLDGWLTGLVDTITKRLCITDPTHNQLDIHLMEARLEFRKKVADLLLTCHHQAMDSMDQKIARAEGGSFPIINPEN